MTGSEIDGEDVQVARANVERAERHVAALETELHAYEVQGKKDRASQVREALSDAKSELKAAEREYAKIAPEAAEAGEPGTFRPLAAHERPHDKAGIPTADRADAANGAPLGDKVKRDKDDPKPSKAAIAASKAADRAVAEAPPGSTDGPQKFGVEAGAGPNEEVSPETPTGSEGAPTTEVPLTAQERPLDEHDQPVADSVEIEKRSGKVVVPSKGSASAKRAARAVAEKSGRETATRTPRGEKAVKSAATKR